MQRSEENGKFQKIKKLIGKLLGRILVEGWGMESSRGRLAEYKAEIARENLVRKRFNHVCQR